MKLLLTSILVLTAMVISAAAAPASAAVVFSDGFDGYSPGNLTSQGTWLAADAIPNSHDPFGNAASNQVVNSGGNVGLSYPEVRGGTGRNETWLTPGHTVYNSGVITFGLSGWTTTGGDPIYQNSHIFLFLFASDGSGSFNFGIRNDTWDDESRIQVAGEYGLVLSGTTTVNPAGTGRGSTGVVDLWASIDLDNNTASWTIYDRDDNITTTNNITWTGSPNFDALNLAIEGTGGYVDDVWVSWVPEPVTLSILAFGGGLAHLLQFARANRPWRFRNAVFSGSGGKCSATK